MSEVARFYGHGRTLLCWDCKELMGECDAHRVRTNPGVPEWMSKSTTLVCPTCHDRRVDPPDSVEVSEG